MSEYIVKYIDPPKGEYAIYGRDYVYDLTYEPMISAPYIDLPMLRIKRLTDRPFRPEYEKEKYKLA